MSAVTPGAVASPAAMLAKGRECYNGVKYSKAIAWFTEAIKTCPCGVHITDKVCACKSLLDAIKEERLDEELRKECICSVQSNRRCTNGLHLDALDSLAATHEARLHLKMAFIVAQTMVNLFPREPKPFLRLGKLFRMEDQYRAAYRTYEQGYKLVAKKNKNHALLPFLIQNKDKIKYRAFAADPLTVLPAELALEVFKHVGFRSLCLSTRVSRSWKNFLLERDAPTTDLLGVKRDSFTTVLWRRLAFTSINKAVQLPQMMRYQLLSDNQMTELHIGDCLRFGLNSMFLHWIMKKCATLKVLSLCATSRSANHTYHLNPMPVSSLRLKKLHIGYYCPISEPLLDSIIYSSASTLEELVILNFSTNCVTPIRANFPDLLQLKSLHLSCSDWDTRVDLELMSFIYKTPNIEELWLDNMSVLLQPEHKPDYYWTHLKRMFIGEDVDWPPRTNVLPFEVTDKIEELYLLSYDAVHCLLVIPLQTEGEGDEELPVLHRLRKFFLMDFRNTDPTAQRADWLQPWLTPSLQSGVLEELQIDPFPDLPSWMRSKSLKFLGVPNIALYSTYPTADAAVCAALSRFPTVTAIDIFGQGLSEGGIGNLITRNGIKKVYNSRPFHDLGQVRMWAHTNGLAQIIQKKYIDAVAIHPEGFI
ncbi:hypothetical protein GGR57DRAFT_474118 [Xylariaceae sp. FL1272]|nr:hypothetical protein GGR57DRAFT_474118 [Xylariaceae sp. FL1272]